MTKIEWTDQSWNPWVGCDKIAPECGLLAPGNPRPEGGGCYAAVFASRNLHETHRGTAVRGEWTGVIKRAPPTHWQAPKHYPRGKQYPPYTLVFTCSMSDFWHEAVPPEWQDEALDMIEATRARGNIYQILTKRPAMAIRRLALLKRRLPPNVWAGATVGHPKSLPLLKPLRRIEATKHFLSKGVPFFLKQWGLWENNPTPRKLELDPDAKGGTTLDGRLWREFPR